MRINIKPGRLLALSSLGLAFSLALAGIVSAQESQQAPAQFGPRANKQQQQQQQQQQGQQGQPAPKVDLIAENGKWKVQCETPPAPEGQKPVRQCGMVQSTQSEKNPKATLTLVLVKTDTAEKSIINMRVIAPIGVFLPTGVALEIDGEAVGRVPFTRCMPQVCMAFAEASPETLAKLKKGKEANFIIYEAPGIGLPMKLSLSGFTASLDALQSN
ncbi:invasion associated locus B family protein [Aestuariivirga sp.]|uniref:invasion associated locus B family protein n=1 Tax=Aestuariivirga sp. TaxID=2650926 RepID=UPI0037840C20